MRSVLQEKGEYKLIIDLSKEDNQWCYKVVNKETEVVEAETRILPQAYKFLEELSAALDAYRDLMIQDAKEKREEV